jgi:hypothetical protein
MLLSDRRSLGDVAMPDSLPPAVRAAAVAVESQAFLWAFRGAFLLSAAFAFAGGVVAAATIGAADAAAAPTDMPIPTCDHLGAVADPKPRSAGCEECLRTGDTWVHLRLCLSCGQVGCCDSSRNRHATKHFWSSRHPIVRSLEPGEDWRWCYVDEIAV